jgi:uncharacterized membrane protein (DUF485 family)
LSKKSKKNQVNSAFDYEKVINTPEFKNLVKRKRRFSTPYIIFFFAAFFTLPILTGYTSILEARAIGWMTWTWVYSLLMFVMVWVFTSIYMKKAKSFDIDVEEILKKHVIK